MDALKQGLRRTADWLEKISVACVVVGLFQTNEELSSTGFILGGATFIVSHVLDLIRRKLC